MKNRKGTIIGLNSGIFWGISTVILGLALNNLNAFGNAGSLTATWIHDSVSAILMLILLVFMKKIGRMFQVLKTKSGIAIIIAALLGGPLGMGAYLLSINYLGPSVAASISAIYPAFGALLAYLILKEHISKRQIVGLLIAVSAIMLMGFSNQLSVDNLPLGLISVFLCVLGWGSEAVIIGYAMKDDVEAEVALGIRQLTSAIVYGAIIIPLLGYESFTYILGDTKVLSLIMVAGLFGTVSYLFYYKAIDLIGATKAMALNITYPAWAFFFQVILMSQFSFPEFILVLVILLGTFIGIEKEPA